MEDYSDGDLGRMIVSWSVSSIREEVQIPNMQERDELSSLEYLKGFEKPLIQQIKARILSSLNSLSQSAYYKMLGVLKTKSDDLVFIDIDPSYGDHIVQEGDLFLLSSEGPKQLEEISNESGVFALAANIGHNNHYVRGFSAKTSGVMNSDPRYAIFLCNISESVHIWNTLHMGIGDRTMIKQISSPLSLSLAAKSCPICATKMKTSDLSMSCDLNKAQEHLATKMVSRANCDHAHSIDVACGFAGTGKTKTVSVVLAALLQSKMRTVVCAPNVLHCSTLSCYLLDLVKDQSVGDVLLLCDMREITNDAAKQFCLELKINEIMPCMLWRGKMHSLISFLEKDFRELCKGGIKGAPSVLELLKELFGRKSNTLTKLLMTLWKYFPRNVFSEKVAEELTCLFDALKGFNDLLAKEGITNEHVMTVFGIYSGTTSPAKPKRSKFSSNKNPRAASSHSKSLDLKNKCLKHLKSLETTLALPFEKDTEWIRGFLVQEATLIISIPSNAFLLHKDDTRQMKMLIVVGAEQIPECELLPTLSLPSIEHIWVIGDHTRLCPTVKDQVNEDIGFGLSLFDRLISLGLEDHLLTTQYRMHPEICSLASSHFYEGKLISSAKSTHLDVTKSKFGHYWFVNVDAEREPAAILFLITKVFEDWSIPIVEHQDTKLEVGVVCSVEKQKLLQGCDCGPISLSIQSFEKLKSKVYDILIIAADGLPNDKTVIRYLITRARKHLWILGDEAKLGTNSIWKSLIDDAKQRDVFIESTTHATLSASFKNKVSSWDSLKYALGITTIHKKTPREFSWLGRPYNEKLLLPPVRDQRGENHCTLHASLATTEFQNKHRSASLVPPQDFNPNFSADRLLTSYIKIHGEFGKENCTGRVRLENVLGILQTVGANSESDNAVHKISSFHDIYDSSDKNEKLLEAAASKPRQGKAMIGTFLLSENYSEYRPEDIYMFDPKRAVLSPLSRKPSSHAVMLIGGTDEASSEILLEDGYFVMQNSQGEYFGRGGFGRVAMSTIQRLYDITL